MFQVEPVEQFVIAIVVQIDLSIRDSLLRTRQIGIEPLSIAQRLLHMMYEYIERQYGEVFGHSGVSVCVLQPGKQIIEAVPFIRDVQPTTMSSVTVDQ